MKINEQDKQLTRVRILEAAVDVITIKGFKAILSGEYDHLPEQAFYMVGGIDEAAAKAETLN